MAVKLSEHDLGELQERILRCKKCSRLVTYRHQVAERKVRRYQRWQYWGRPVPSFGDPRARLLVIGLAPAAHGGNRTGRIFTGDRSGDWLYEALHRFGFANQFTSVSRNDGLTLQDCYITAAIHCAPPQNKPFAEELVACRPYFLEELRLLRDVRVVVALGKIAFDAFIVACQELGRPFPRPRPRFEHGRAYHHPEGIVLLASYHPSQQNTLTGRLTRPMLHAVFRQARRLVRGLSGTIGA